MADTLEKQFYDEILNESDPNITKELIKQGVDCNFLYFNPSSPRFISPIRLVSRKKPYDTLCLLYEHRKNPTKTQLEEHLQFYINHYDPLQIKRNEMCFDYIVSRFLYSCITTQCGPNSFYTLIAALHDIDGAKRRNRDLCDGSTHEAFLQLRIYTLFQMIIDEIIKPNCNDETLNILKNELLQNLETYYFLDGILQIPEVTQDMITMPFTEVESSLKKYYEPIAKNLIKKIKQLEINQEYTVPTGWLEHAVCVSFRCVSSSNETYICIRVDNPSHLSSEGEHEVETTSDSTKIRPKVLGQLDINDLDKNLEYFILLIDSVRRDLSLTEGRNLIYNRENKIVGLITKQIEDVSRNEYRKPVRHDSLPYFSERTGENKKETSQEDGDCQVTELADASLGVPLFDVQAQANCFVKCYEPGSWMRFGEKYNKLHKQIILEQQNNANRLIARWEEGYGRSSRVFFKQFNELIKDSDVNGLSITYMKPLQDQLKMCYQQNLQYMWSDIFQDFHGQLIEKYIPLRCGKDNRLIDLENIFTERHILLVADAGCGKTILCQYVTYLWAHEKLWNNKFEWLFYIKMKNINSTSYPSRPNEYSLIDIIARECFRGCFLNHIDKPKLMNNLRNSTKILWVLDGCDERNIPDYLSSIEQELFSQVNLLLTCRPYQTYNLKNNIRIEIKPFIKEDIQNYIMKYFPADQKATADLCWSYIEDDFMHLNRILQFPACLQIICSLFRQDKNLFKTNMTIGEIYQKMCEDLLRKYLLRYHDQNTSPKAGKDIFQEPNAKPFIHLELLAFQATKKHEYKILGKDLVSIAGNESCSVLQIGLLKVEDQAVQCILEANNYHFVHPSFQEYLCARYMINALSLIYLRELDKEIMQFTTKRENELDEFLDKRKQEASQFMNGRDEDVVQFTNKRDKDVFQFLKEREEEGIQFMKQREEKVIRFMKEREKEKIQLMEKGEEEVIQFIRNEKYNRNLQHTFQLFFELKPPIECINQFWLAVDSQPRDLVGIRHCGRIIRWIRKEMCGSPEEDNIQMRTIAIVQDWINNENRKAHDFGNEYIFEWFKGLIENESWWKAWEQDLLIEESSKRRYFLPDLWSVDNIEALKKIYKNISKDDVPKLYALIRDGPTQRNLEPLELDPTLFTLDISNDPNEIPEFIKEAQTKAREHESLTDVEKFRTLLISYSDFAKFNRRTMVSGTITWPLKIAPPLLRNIADETLAILSQLIKENALFYRNFTLPIVPVLQLYAKSTDQNDHILRSLIVSITFSTGCMLTAPFGTEKDIEVHKIHKDEQFMKIPLDEQRRRLLVKEFDETRTTYGYSRFFSTQ